jgi:hypothetical protein
MILFKKSSSNIMVTRNPDWSTEILWYETVCAKGKILHPLNVLHEAGCIDGFVINC